jgi:hypothetical protein
MRETLKSWGELTIHGPVSEGNRNLVVAVSRGSERFIARRSRRSPESLEAAASWQIEPSYARRQLAILVGETRG